jgi:hypothetical protein
VKRSRIDSPLQQLIIDYLKGIDVSQRKFGNELKVSSTRFGTYFRMTSAMSIELLDKILTTYPGVKEVLIKHLSRNTDDNLTDLTKNMNNEDLNLEVKMVKRLLAFMDEAKTELQRKYDRLQSEVDGLRMENQSLKEQLRNCTSTDDKSK